MIEKAQFGRSGHASTRVIFGAASLSRVDQDRADQVLQIVESHGVNHIDTAADYGDAEIRLAPWLAVHRREVFLATKTAKRSGPDARAELERSLERLGVDRVDSIQLHNLVEEDEWEEAHAPGGAVEALARAKDEGLVANIGVTGHGLRIPRMHIRSLERYDFASVLFPFNYVLLSHPGYRSDVTELIEVCRSRGVALQTIKSVARRRWTPGESRRKRSWYEPLEDRAAIARAVGYVLGEPDLFLCTSSDYEVLPMILEAASGPLPIPTDAQLATDVDTYEMAPLFDGSELERI